MSVITQPMLGVFEKSPDILDVATWQGESVSQALRRGEPGSLPAHALKKFRDQLASADAFDPSRGSSTSS
jgi:hypothetical protein